MRTEQFERFAVHQGRLYVSVCRTCLRFIAASPEAMRLAFSEGRHECARPPKKPAGKVLIYAADTTRKIADALPGSD